MAEKASRRQQSEQKLKQLLQFERLISEISNRFINLPTKKVDSEIVNTLQHLIKFLKFDRSSIMRFSPDLKNLIVTHTYARPGIETLEGLVMSDMFPWYTEQMRKGEAFTFHKMFDETPEDAIPEREYIARIGMKSNLTAPLRAQGSLVGAITFGSFDSYFTACLEMQDTLEPTFRIFRGLWRTGSACLVMKQPGQEIWRKAPLEILIEYGWYTIWLWP